MKHVRFSVVLVALLVSASLAACGDDASKSAAAPSDGAAASSDAPDLKGKRLVYVNYGGEVLKHAQTAMLDPFGKATGAQFATDSPTDVAKIKAMVETGNVTWDVVDADPGAASAECGKLFEKLDTAKIDMAKIDKKYITDDCSIPFELQNIVLAWNKDKFGDDPPTKLADFLDTKRFPGKRIILNYPTGSLEPILAADGVPVDQIYPLDMKRAFAAMDRIKKDIVFVKEPALHQEVLLSGDFAMCLCYNGRAGAAAAQGADFGVIWDKSFSLWDGLYIVKGSPNVDAANAFLNYVSTDPQPQAKFAELTAYGSTQLDSKPSIEGALGALIPGPHAEEIGEPFLYDPKWWTDNGPKAYEEWTAYTAG